MADFAVLAAAAAPAFGWSGEDFRRAYRSNREMAIDRVLDADPVAEAILDFARQAYSWGERTWSGTMTTLLEEIGRLVAEDTRRERAWPTDATRLSARLRRAAPAMRSRGVTLTFFREADKTPLPDGTKPVRRKVSIHVQENGA